MSAAVFLTSADIVALAGTPVVVYRNLHFRDRTVWSIARATGTGGKGRLIGYVEGSVGIILAGVSARVSEPRRQAIIRTGSREVVAWLSGIVFGVPALDCESDDDVTFNPRACATFFHRASGATFTRATSATFGSKVSVL